MVKLRDLRKHIRLGLIIAGRDHDRHHVVIAEYLVDLLTGKLPVVEVKGHCVGIIIQKRVVERKVAAHDEHHGEYRRDDLPCFPRKAAGKVDMRDKAAVAGLVDSLVEGQKKPRHQKEHRQHRKQDRLDEHAP